MLATKLALSMVGRKECLIGAFVLEAHLSAQIRIVTRCSSRRRLAIGVGTLLYERVLGFVSSVTMVTYYPVEFNFDLRGE